MRDAPSPDHTKLLNYEEGGPSQGRVGPATSRLMACSYISLKSRLSLSLQGRLLCPSWEAESETVPAHRAAITGQRPAQEGTGQVSSR